MLLVFGRMLNALADPPVRMPSSICAFLIHSQMGYYSDKSTLRFGRRIPFIAGGTPLLSLFFALLWFPPAHHDSVGNAIYFAFTFFVYNVCFAFVTAPYTALSPEITAVPKDRCAILGLFLLTDARSVVMSTFIGVFSLVGNFLGALVGPFQSAFPDGVSIGAVHFRSGVQFCGALGGLMHLVGFLLPLIVVRERAPARPLPPASSSSNSSRTLLSEFAATLKNPAFLALMGVTSVLPMGVAFVAGGLPYLCTQVLERAPGQPGLVPSGAGATWAGIIGAILIGGALLWMPVVGRLSVRFGKRRVTVRKYCFYVVFVDIFVSFC